MTAKYFAILTNQGAARLANAAALGTRLNLTQMAVGDANGTLPTPDPAQTKLINQRRIAPLNLLTVDPANTSQIIAEQIIPENEGGFWIREIGLYDDDGILIAVANCPETYKPELQEGSGRTQTIRMILIVSSTSAITLKIDPSVVLATRQYVDDRVIEVKNYADGLMRAHEQSRNHPDATTTAKGFTQLNSSVMDDRETQAATPKAVKIAMDNANARLAKERNLADLPNPALARQNLQLGDSSMKNTGTTANTVAAGDDARITGAMQKSQNGGDIPDVAKFLKNLGLNETLNPSKRISIGTLGAGLFDGSKPAINIGDSDSGFIFESDGVIGIYANNQKIAELTNTGIKSIGYMTILSGALILDNDTYFLRHSSADDAGFSGNNIELASWNGIGFPCTYDQITRIYLNTRTGVIGLTGDLKAGGNVYSGSNAWLDQTGNLQGSAWGEGVGLKQYIANQIATQKSYIDNGFNKKNTASLAVNGWHKDESNGIITQWGAGNTTTNGANVTYPIPFPNACTSIAANERNNNITPVIINFSGVGKTGFTVQAWNNNAARVDSSISWVATGY
ncbi:phage tail-collar fiber domain-containing protein [Enterobacter roggenkampii]|uniref:phage tail-collar fiber domain-containing protein n=1 Tax=Enterobacter roggenkampii TaxID=1812935 RepID=UPI00210E692D|nr:phage tail protein [Enterobacter roggenkampii]MCQ4393317.1 phage tail protein [Enterobacter roggenkampii]